MVSSEQRPTGPQPTDEPEADPSHSHSEPRPYNLPPVPSFSPLVHLQPPHKRRVTLPPTFPDAPDFRCKGALAEPFERVAESVVPRPGSFFKLFFSQDIYDILCQNTNAYAAMKEASKEGKREWKELQPGELKIWHGIIIYMGVHASKSGKTGNFWRRDDHGPVSRHDLFL